jgi:hypothetical protein
MRHGRTDENQTETVATLRKVGCKVAINSDAGYGIPDLIVWSPMLRKILLIELKDGDKPPSKRQLTKAQKTFHKFWKETGAVHVAKNPDEALLLCGYGWDVDRLRKAGL